MPVDVTDLPLLGAGREADVYALDDVRVLRRYRRGADASHEARVMRHVAAHGYPVPTVHDVAGPDLVMDRLTGPTMAHAMLSWQLPPDEGARILADLHRDLHALPPYEGTDPILHLDLHPENVLITPAGPVVIDWHNATTGPADYDIAVTALIFGELVLSPMIEVPEIREMVRGLLRTFLVHAGGRPETMLDRAITKRLDDQMLSAEEKANLGAAAAVVADTVAQLPA
jgi:aminoglycoside phosphotransferase (APT) family kinase protein